MPTSEAVNALRKRTGAGMGPCKDALVTAAGDLDAAAELLRYAGTCRYAEVLARVQAGALGSVQVIDDIEYAIDQASDVMHNSQRWRDEDVFADYITPKLDAARVEIDRILKAVTTIEAWLREGRDENLADRWIFAPNGAEGPIIARGYAFEDIERPNLSLLADALATRPTEARDE